jgi:hypothetical protein
MEKTGTRYLTDASIMAALDYKEILCLIKRSVNQVKEDISVRVLRYKLLQEWVVQSYGADYGIDCVVELFDFIDEEKNIAESLGENFLFN